MRLRATGRPGFYRVLGGPAGIETFTVSSAAGRTVLSDALLVGASFQRHLTEAVTEALRGLPAVGPGLAELVHQDAPAVLYILRGGLNFGTQAAVENALGRPSRVGFVSAARSVVGGVPRVALGEYERLDDWGGALVVIADIAATGETMCRAFARLSADWSPSRAPRRVVLVCVATVQAVSRIARTFTDLLRRVRHPSPPSLTVVALEGLFGVYEGREKLEHHLVHTDFLRRGGVLTPEFAAASYGQPRTILERCVVYDGGARGFSPHIHRAELLSYWSALVRRFAADHGRIRAHLGAKADLAGLDRPFDAWLAQQENWASLPAESLSNVYAAGRVLADLSSGDLLETCTAHLEKVRSTVSPTPGDHR